MMCRMTEQISATTVSRRYTTDKDQAADHAGPFRRANLGELCILTIFMAGFCAAHLAKDVRDTPPLATLTTPDEGVFHDFVTG